MILAGEPQTSTEHWRRVRPHSKYFAWSLIKEEALIACLVDEGMRDQALE